MKTQTYIKAQILAVLTLGSLFNTAKADAALAQDSTQSVSFFVVDGRVRDVLNVLGATTDVRIVQSGAVVGRIQQKQLAGNIEDILTALGHDIGLDWFKFNGHYYVSQRQETVSRAIRLGSLPARSARSALEEAGLAGQNLQILDGSDGASLILTGPPRLVAFSEVIVANIPESRRPNKGPGIIVRRGVSIVSESSIQSQPVE